MRDRANPSALITYQRFINLRQWSQALGQSSGPALKWGRDLRRSALDRSEWIGIGQD